MVVGMTQVGFYRGVGGEGAVGALGEGEGEGVDRRVGDRVERARGDAGFADEGVTDEVDRDVIAL